MKKLLHICILCLTALTLTQCIKDNGGLGGDSSDVIIDTADPDEYVDLGLISMTMWKATNEVNEADNEHDFFTYDEAVATFDDKLPTKEQFEELMRSCRWVWVDVGFYKVYGPNGKYIIMQAAGSRDCDDRVNYVNRYGFYWSSTPDGNTQAWYLNFYSGEKFMYNYRRCFGNSVRLVKDIDDY